ncbi:MAG: DNA gyrase subunit A [Spirochaetes bacterium]|nr:DNA gyrase subunit A [Spirochaetota bacterium]
MPRRKKGSDSLQLFDRRIVPVYIEEEMKNSYIDYAMSVIIGRALPDVRDGLKPVHRRILFAMNERRWTYGNPYVKCAKIVGEVIGNFHPHGDTAVYDTLVRMAQPFSMGVPLVDGQGNFGSVDGDNPAAYRYTEARLSAISEELIKDINKDTVNFVGNFDETRKEPLVMPAAFPNLLVNGANGIAVGMATNIPTHNLAESINAVISFIENSDIKIAQLMQLLPGPDFPTGGILYGYQGVKEAYTRGKGKVTIRARTNIEEKKGKEYIVITELPFQVNKSSLISSIADLVREKKLDGITHLRDESDRQGMRVVLEVRKDVNSQVVLNQLFKHTQMQITFGIIMLALVDNQPRVLTLKQIIEEYVKHRKEVVKRRTRFDLEKAQARAHILQGLIKALDSIDAIIKTIRASKNVETAKNALMSRFKFTDIQALAILDMKLQRLTQLEKIKLEDELEGLLKLIKELKAILASPKKMNDVIKNEMLEIKQKYSSPRRTQIVKETTEFTMEDIIVEEDMIISISRESFIKSLQARLYKKQRKAFQTTAKSSQDYIKHLLVASTHDHLLFFTNRGKVFWMKVYEIPIGGKQIKGKSLKVILNLTVDEYITNAIAIKDFNDNNSFILVTKKGMIKKVTSPQFTGAKKRGIIAINLEKEDELAGVIVFEKNRHKEIFIGTRSGKGLKINGEKIREMGRASRGIKGISIHTEDRVIGMVPVKQTEKLLVVTDNGFAKRIPFNEFPCQGRAGKGVIYLKIGKKNGPASCLAGVDKEEEIIITTLKGMILRTLSDAITVSGRGTTGIKIIDPESEDRVSDLAVLKSTG